MNEPKVLIMMATYNGEKYIEELLKSVLRQTYTGWDMVIRDDGSNDHTIKIIEKYLDGRHIQLIRNNTNIHGTGANFRGLVTSTEQPRYDYYMFCDQDDVWDDDKVERMVHTANRYAAKSVPVMVYADMRLMDAEGKITDESLHKIYDMTILRPLMDCFVTHRGFGCNMLFNYELFEKLQRLMADPEWYPIEHDMFAMKVAAAYNGVFEFIDSPCMSYRRHGSNVTASQTSYKISIRRIINKIEKFDELAKNHAYTWWCSLCTAKLLLKQDDISNRNTIKDFSDSIVSGGFKGCLIWLKYKVSCGAKVRTLSNFLVLLSGRYKKYMREVR